MLFLLVLAGCPGDNGVPTSLFQTAILEFEGGALYAAERIHVVQLNGSYGEMGRQYGRLLKDQVNSYYDKAIVEHPPWGGNWSQNEAKAFARRNYDNYPQRAKAIFEGMAETSGLSVDQLMLIDQYTELFVASEVFGCSGLGTWGDYTIDGSVVLGKNEDMPLFFKEFNDSLSVIVYNPDDGSRSVASVCNAGQVKVMNGMNDVGIVNVTYQAPFLEGVDPSINRVPLFINHFAFLLDSDSLTSMIARVESYLPPVSINGTAADGQLAVSYEVSQSHVAVRTPDTPGSTAQTNHYLDPSWDPSLLEKQEGEAGDSETRRSNLLAQAEQHKGSIDARIMMDIYDIHRDQGGATVDDTTYQMVAVPSELVLWIKAPGYQDWVEVDLNELF